MKKILALTLAMLLLALPALAEDRYTTIEVEGMPEILAETKYENTDVGFTFWYTPDTFTVLWDTLSDAQGQLMIHCAEESGVPVFITVELPEKTGMSGLAYLQNKPVADNVPASSLHEIQTAMTEGGDTLYFRAGHDDTTYYEYYLVQKNGKELQLFTSYALEMADGYGTRIDHLVSTFSLN